MLRRSLLIGMIALTVCGTAAFAHEGHEGKGMMDSKARVEKMTKDLNLTPDQATKIQGILDAKKEQTKAAWEETQGQVDAVLTPEQKAKHDAMKEEWKSKAKEGKGKKHHGQ